MESVRNWLLPLALMAGQLLVWPGAVEWDGHPVVVADVTVAVAAGTAVTGALALRRRAPLIALAGVVVVAELGRLVVPADAVVVYALVGEPVAVYSVAARTTLPATLRAVGVLVGFEALVSLAADGVGLAHRADQVLTAAVCLVGAGLGRGRARWLASRAQAAGRLERARAERREAATAERRRLARELHDVSAHHLTSVVVTANAAGHLAGSRPELAAEALEFAARTGRETLDTLHRLVDTLRTAEEDDDGGHVPLAERLGELAAGFVRLGQPVEVEVDVEAGVEVGQAVADAVFGIAREALTNALRYAPGAPVRVEVRDPHDGRLTLTIVNEAHSAAGSAVSAGSGVSGSSGIGRGLGSGRGTAGMKERAAAVGGTVTAGPRPGPAGGWSVRAELPAHPAHPAHPGGTRVSGLVGVDWRFAEHAALLGVLAVPAALLFGEPRGAGARLLLGALLLVQVLPLLWRRRMPWAALAAVGAGVWGWPWLPGAGDPVWVLAAGGCALLAAVYAVGANGGTAWASWVSVPSAAGSLGGAAVAAAARDGVLDGRPAGALAIGVGVFALALLLLPPLGAAWLAGFAVRSRRTTVTGREDSELGQAVHDAVAAAHAERQRVAAGLRSAVLDRAADVVRVAEEGRLEEVAPAAREALAAMRELLGSLRDGTPAGETREDAIGAGHEGQPAGRR
ncbi:sensor histidine kinase [Streptomyces soliscabiei]|uniref:sensor histidine kinase n=1 Tax=Streptomyces soliscabiei TaxID=588897 RepID=UPI0029B98BC7|nr:histidine kinase [Streptomyces sp. NY05-11A]MDX2677369.1 histidine kinase [Streptomyces sp. NY05-11A]